MTRVEERVLFKIDTNPINGSISVRIDDVVKEGDTEISRIPHRHALVPFVSVKNSDGTWTHTDTDLSNEHDSVQAVAAALWTDEIKETYKEFVESSVF